MTIKSVFLVMNPSSRSFTGQRGWPRIFELLGRSGVDYGYEMTEKAGDGARLAASAAENGFDAVIAVGGDGTINEVISGTVHALQGNPLLPASFGVIYTGTSPDFCRYHGIPLDPDVVVPRILQGSPRRVDLCRINHLSSEDRHPVSKFFSCSANFGLGAEIARGSNTGLRKRFGDFVGTLLSVLNAVKNYSPPRFRLKIDGVERSFARIHNIFIGKNPFIASGIKLKLDIAADGGLMYLVPLSGISRFELLSVIPRVYTGSFCNRFEPIICRQVEILDGEGATEVEYDGDPQGLLPASISVISKVLPLLGGWYRDQR